MTATQIQSNLFNKSTLLYAILYHQLLCYPFHTKEKSEVFEEINLGEERGQKGRKKKARTHIL